MHVRRFACLLLGIWIGGILLMNVVTIQNLASVGHVLGFHPEGSEPESVKKLGGREATRVVLSHLASEQNRAISSHWESTQIALAIGMLLLIVFGTHEGKLSMTIALLTVVIVLVQHLIFSPAITGLGRELDFMTAVDHAGIRRQFSIWRTSYFVLEFLKVGLCLMLVSFMMRSRSSTRRRFYDKDDSGKKKRLKDD